MEIPNLFDLRLLVVTVLNLGLFLILIRNFPLDLLGNMEVNRVRDELGVLLYNLLDLSLLQVF